MELREEIHEVKRGRVAGLVFATNCRRVLGTSELNVVSKTRATSFLSHGFVMQPTTPDPHRGLVA